MVIRKLVIEIIVSILILMWTYAAISKLLDFETFKLQLGQSPLVREFATLTAIILPLIEITIAGLLIFRKTRTPGFWSSFWLMTVFTCYLIWMLKYSPDIPCSCGGIIGKGLAWEEHIFFNLFFVAIASMAIVLESGKLARFMQKISQNTAQSGQAENL